LLYLANTTSLKDLTVKTSKYSSRSLISNSSSAIWKNLVCCW